MLHYQTSGTSNQTLVLIHGFCENSSCFNPLIKNLAKHYQVICPDLPGFGSSEAISNCGIEQMADSIAELINHLNISECIMLGHSMGAYVTLAFEKKYPQYNKVFGLMHSTALADSDERKEKRKQVIQFIKQHGKEAYINNFIPTLFYDIKACKHNCDLLINEAMKSSEAGIVNAVEAMMTRDDNTQILKTTNKPVFFAIGKHDSLIPENDMLQQAIMCKQSELSYLENSAHCSMYEEPDKLSQAIIKLKRQLD